MNIAVILILAFSAIGTAHGYSPCGSLENDYGPFDYRTDKAKLGIVERHHFDSGVENLVRPLTGRLGGDLDYTLRAFPNHHRALAAMARLGQKMRSDRPGGATYKVPCYFERAVRFRPNDGVVRMLFANFLISRGYRDQALQHATAASKLAGSDANLHYNVGVIYVKLQQYDQALAHAHRASELGFPMQGLRNMLERAGKWQEPQKNETAATQPAVAAEDAVQKP